MSTVFIAGKQYLVTRDQDPYVKAGSIVTYTKVGRFVVRWEDGVSEYCRNGDCSLVGYDREKRIYELFLIKDFIVEMAPIEKDQERFDKIDEAIDCGDKISSDDMHYYVSINGDWPDGYVNTVDTEEYVTKADAYHCPVGDCWYSDDDEFVNAHNRDGDEIRAHIDSVNSSSEFFQCDRSGEYYSRRWYSRVFVADMSEHWCLEDNDYDITYCEDDDYYYVDSDNMPSRCRIPSYHSQSRRWRIPSGITLGTELEVYVDDAEHAYTNRASEIIGERDGSLDSEYGIEFIGPPMNYMDYLKPRNPWAVTLEGINDAGCVEDKDFDRKDGYGMHVSVGRSALSSEVQARFVLFINNCQDFSEFIAQRSANRWAQYDKKDVKHVQESFIACGIFGQWGSKYSATHIDSERIEVRIFKSVTEPELFQKNIDYVYSALMFVTEHDDIADVISVHKYLTWLNGQEGYVALKAFVGDNGKRFEESDTRRAMLSISGFIIEESDYDSTI
jgi:hypothetical protein